MFIVGADIGGTATRLVVTDATGQVTAADSSGTAALLGHDPATAPKRLLAFIMSQLPRGCRPAAVGIAATGPVDPGTGTITNPYTLPALTGVPLQAALADHLGVRCAVVNDAAAAAVGELRHGSGQDADTLLMVTLGTGIGVAVVARDGRPLTGARGAHPEAGHHAIRDAGPACYCGLTGCWETLASRSAIERRAAGQEAGADPELSADSDPDPASDPTPGSADRLARAAEAGSPEAQQFFRCIGQDIGRGLANLLAVYAPDVCVLAGSALRWHSHFAAGLREALSRAPEFDTRTVIRLTALGENAGAIGAAAIARALELQPESGRGRQPGQ